MSLPRADPRLAGHSASGPHAAFGYQNNDALYAQTKINKTDFSKLVEMALREFISSKKMIELQPVSLDEAMAATDRVMARHKKAIDELK